MCSSVAWDGVGVVDVLWEVLRSVCVPIVCPVEVRDVC